MKNGTLYTNKPSQIFKEETETDDSERNLTQQGVKDWSDEGTCAFISLLSTPP